jgi:hypothetical protein
MLQLVGDPLSIGEGKYAHRATDDTSEFPFVVLPVDGRIDHCDRLAIRSLTAS